MASDSAQPDAARNRRSRPRRPRGRAADQPPVRRPRRTIPVPELRYPSELPVVARKDDIAATIRDHQVVVIAGETGSGKTTQLPKICLELGRGIAGMTALGSGAPASAPGCALGSAA